MPDPILQRLGLATDPFYPDQILGKKIDPKLFEKALNPDVEPLLLHHYHNVYHWSDSRIIGALNPGAGFARFPAPDEIDDPILIIVSGTEDTGRASMLNLVLHSIRRQARKTYEIGTKETSRHQPTVVKAVAMNFITKWKFNADGYTKQDLTDALKLHTGSPSTGTETHYPDLFTYLREAADAANIDAVVVLVQKGDDYDVWSSIYKSVESMAKYVIVETTIPEKAAACYKQVSRDGGKAVLLDARRLDRSSAESYLVARLQAERAARQYLDDLWPFSKAALDALYAPGEAPPRDGVRFPIGSLRGMLRATFDDHLESLRKAEAALANMTDDECRISADAAKKASTNWQGSNKKSS